MGSLQWHMEGKHKVADWWWLPLFTPYVSTNQVHNSRMVLLVIKAGKGIPGGCSSAIAWSGVFYLGWCAVEKLQEIMSGFRNKNFWEECTSYFHSSSSDSHRSKIKRQLLYYTKACKPAVFFMFGSQLQFQRELKVAFVWCCSLNACYKAWQCMLEIAISSRN